MQNSLDDAYQVIYIFRCFDTLSTMSNKITFYVPGIKHYETEEFVQKAPSSFLPFSVTGNECALGCDHCKGELLRFMRPTLTPEDLIKRCRETLKAGLNGVLISGGCNIKGRVPLERYFDALRYLKKDLGLKIFVHSGLLDDFQARGLHGAEVDAVLLDVIGSNQTIKEVYHLGATIEDYEASLYVTSRYNIPIMPHIVLGLQYGRLVGEENALDIASHYKLKALVLVILTPLLGTPMEGVEPPNLKDVRSFFAKAKEKLPQTPIILGCARPMGQYKQEVDRLAVEAGLDGIAFPAEGIISFAVDKGKEVSFTESCCGFNIP
ncbi:MAG TPA: radical SAM protein [Candidatus Hypogeohydataceae bacterium YC41]